MDPLPPATRRANRWLFTGMIVFAVVFAVVIFIWMRHVVRANGGVVDPQPRRTSFQREPSSPADFVLRTAPPCLT